MAVPVNFVFRGVVTGCVCIAVLFAERFAPCHHSQRERSFPDAFYSALLPTRFEGQHPSDLTGIKVTPPVKGKCAIRMSTHELVGFVCNILFWSSCSFMSSGIRKKKVRKEIIVPLSKVAQSGDEVGVQMQRLREPGTWLKQDAMSIRT